MAVKIFFCYAHEDEELLKKLKTHLRPLQRQGFIDVWYDREISAGAEWEQEIKQHLNTAQIILLLVSPDFMDSDYCYGIEMRRAIERHKSGEARVIPIILRWAMWRETPIGKLQALPKDGKPVKSWSDLDEALNDVAEGIRTIVELSHLEASQMPQNHSTEVNAPINIQAVSGSIPMPEGVSWIEELTIDKPFSHVWPTQIDKYLQAWKGLITLQGKRINIKIGEMELDGRGRLVVFFNREPMCEFAETLNHEGWSSLIKPDGRKTLQMDETPPVFYQGTCIESHRTVTGLSRAPRGAAVVIPKEDLRSAVHHAVARWLGRRNFPIKVST